MVHTLSACLYQKREIVIWRLPTQYMARQLSAGQFSSFCHILPPESMRDVRFKIETGAGHWLVKDWPRPLCQV